MHSNDWLGNNWAKSLFIAARMIQNDNLAIFSLEIYTYSGTVASEFCEYFCRVLEWNLFKTKMMYRGAIFCKLQLVPGAVISTTN